MSEALDGMQLLRRDGDRDRQDLCLPADDLRAEQASTGSRSSWSSSRTLPSARACWPASTCCATTCGRLYDNVPFDATRLRLEASRPGPSVRDGNTIQLLVMNIQAFQKDVEEDRDPTKANIINREQDRMSGRRPIEFIQATRPVVVIDEPQNMEIRRGRRGHRAARSVLHAPLLGDAQDGRTTASTGSVRSRRTT